MTTREIEESVTMTRKKTIYTCDGCGKDTVVSLSKCCICGKDFCPDCCVYMHDDSKIWHEDRFWCCYDCWKIGRQHIDAMNLKEEEFKAMFEEEIAEWKRDVNR